MHRSLRLPFAVMATAIPSLAQITASVSSYGTGCYDQAASFYEVFQATSFDLSNTSIMLLNTGSGYVVLPGSTPWFTPVGAAIPLSDDLVSSAQPLPFTFPFPGGTTTNLWVSSNGFVWLTSNAAHGCCGGDPNGLLTLGPRHCGVWTDLNPGAGGAVRFDVDTVNSAAIVTWLGVPEYSATANLNTFQLAFYSTGQVDYRYQGCAITTHVTLTGWSPGVNARNPGARDISATMPFITSTDRTPLALGASPRPVLGNTVVLTTTNIPTGSLGGFVGLGFTQHNPGLDFGALGMPGCPQYVGFDTSFLFLNAAATGVRNIVLPSNPFFTGIRFYAQSGVLAPGLNSLGAITSNGLSLLTGTL